MAVCEYELSDSLFFMRLAQAITNGWNGVAGSKDDASGGIWSVKEEFAFIYPAVTASLLLKFYMHLKMI